MCIVLKKALIRSSDVARVIISGGQSASAVGGSHPRGSGGMLPQKILKSVKYRKCDFLHFAGEILQKKIRSYF